MSLRKSPQKMTLKATSSPSLVRSRDKKKTERTWNVDENKGSRFLNLERTWNVIENKCTYVRNPGMLCAPQRRGSPVGGSPTQIVVGKSGS